MASTLSSLVFVHSTPSAHLWVFYDILSAMASSFDVLLFMLDLSSAFDTVNHILTLSLAKIYRDYRDCPGMV